MEKIGSNLINFEDIQNYILAGNAKFTVENPKTKNRGTFKISINKTQKNMYFCSYNYAYEEFKFFGLIFVDDTRKNPKFVLGKGKDSKAQSAIIMDYLINKYLYLNSPNFLNVYHFGKCGKCGRTLTVPESIKSGIGPFCASRG